MLKDQSYLFDIVEVEKLPIKSIFRMALSFNAPEWVLDDFDNHLQMYRAHAIDDLLHTRYLIPKRTVCVLKSVHSV